jgi:Leucine-rich repeat (LRR) protein
MSSIIDYLNSLDENVVEIDISNQCLTEIPDLSRFKQIKILKCNHNLLTGLPPLNETLKTLICFNNRLTLLPPLNHNLQYLWCSNNKLTSLPTLNYNLKILSCDFNEITSLPPLNYNLEYLYCSSNQLTCLPTLNENLEFMYCSYNQINSLPNLNYKLMNSFSNFTCSNNPINQVIGTITKLKIQKWNHFQEFYFLSKLRKKIISWMWKSRETKIKQLCNPIHLENIINEDCETFQNFLDSFGVY